MKKVKMTGYISRLFDFNIKAEQSKVVLLVAQGFYDQNQTHFDEI